MFCGVIQEKGRIQSVHARRGNHVVRVARPRNWRLKMGQSVAVNGICSTVATVGAKNFTVEYMLETLRATTARQWKQGDRVNLERPLAYGDPIESHLVQGHVDAVGKVVAIKKKGASHEVDIEVPALAVPYITQKGALTVDGVALTVARMRAHAITIALIPYTLKHTNMGLLKVGSSVNIETDLVARHIARLWRG